MFSFPFGYPAEADTHTLCSLFKALNFALSRDVVLWDEVHETDGPSKRETWDKLLDHGAKSFPGTRKVIQLIPAVIKLPTAPPDSAAIAYYPSDEVPRKDLDVN